MVNCASGQALYPDGGETFSGNNVVFKDFHHTNINNILFRLPSQQNILRLAFIGHSTCYDYPLQGCIYNGMYGMSDPVGGAACVAVLAIPSATTQRELQTAIHEFGHLVGARDHYGDYINTYPPTESETSEYCIYGDNRNSLPGFLICDACRELMLEEIAASYSN